MGKKMRFMVFSSEVWLGDRLTTMQIPFLPTS
jgi:hypothetical protein